MLLFNPKKHARKYRDDASRQIMLKLIEFFEKRGKVKLFEDLHKRAWYGEFLDHVKEHKLFAKLLTPNQYGDGTSDYRWDTFRNCEFNEILGFYGLQYWYTWQVTILGLGPIWISKNEAIKKKTAKMLNEGGIFGFGLSEKDHGADIYSTEMKLIPQSDGNYKANGRKYYIGNGNEAALVSTLGKISKPGATESDKYENFVFFVVGTKHGKYECVKNIFDSQAYVAEYALHDYPIEEVDVLSKGRDAWDMALNTVNIGKFNLGFGSIGMCTHAFYETLNHSGNRTLYGKRVTDFPHVRQLVLEAYTRLVAMKIFTLRASDYVRGASANDRRYLLYTPIVKMKVTSQGEEVVSLLADVISAKGFEKDSFFEGISRYIKALPRLEGTVHVNMALVVKFMQNYFFNPGQFPDLPVMDGTQSDDFLFNQGPTKGLGNIQFHDYNIAYGPCTLPNVQVFKQQIEPLKEFLMASAADAAKFMEQAKDMDFLLAMGELFTLVAYGQLVLEFAKLNPADAPDELVDQIFDVLVRDFSKYGLKLYSKSSATDKQMEICLKMIKKPVPNAARDNRIWEGHIWPLKDCYEMGL